MRATFVVALVVLTAGCSAPSSSDGGGGGGGGGAAGGGSGGAAGGAAGGSAGGTAGGTAGGAAGGSGAGGGTGGSADGGRWRPAAGLSWQWQLTGALDASVVAEVYDVDMFGTQAPTIAMLHGLGRKVICYVDAAYEPGRPDSSQFTAAVLGNDMVGWPGQKWVDYRTATVRSIMQARFELARTRGCDAIEADDVDAIDNNPGFPLTAADQLDFCRFLATEAHARGMAIGLKNNLAQIPDLVGDFDFAVNEECWRYSECDAEAAFIDAGKPVFHAEYEPASSLTQICAVTRPLGLSTILKNLDLDVWRVACP